MKKCRSRALEGEKMSFVLMKTMYSQKIFFNINISCKGDKKDLLVRNVFFFRKVNNSKINIH
jgi:hypothetical protein